MAEVRTLAWSAWKDRLILPALWAGAAIVVLIETGVTLLSPNLTLQDTYALQDTYYVVADGRYGVSLAAAMVAFAGIYLLLDGLVRAPRRLGHRVAHLGLALTGALLILSPPIALRLMSMPRRYEDIPTAFAVWNWVATVGYALILAGLAVFVLIVIDAIRNRSKAVDVGG
jgi:cytochrome c oxidase subunit 1